MRHEVRNALARITNAQVYYHEMDFQPEENPNDIDLGPITLVRPWNDAVKASLRCDYPPGSEVGSQGDIQ